MIAPPVLDAATWQSLAAAHAERADAFTAGRRERRSRQQKHAIEDFLFEYYPVTPAALRRWHPGVGVALEQPAPHADWRWYAADRWRGRPSTSTRSWPTAARRSGSSTAC